MSVDLCAVWAAFVANPEDAAAAAEARTHLVALLEHVDDCDKCRAASAKIDDAEQVFIHLSEGAPITIPAEELKQIESGRALVADATRAIEDAVNSVLLPSLPDTLQPPSTATPMQVFLATDAVNLLGRSVLAEHESAFVELNAAGMRSGDALVSPRREIVNEIAEHAGVAVDLADDLLGWQLLAGEKCSRLYRGLTVFAFHGSLFLGLRESRPAEELADQWEPQFADADPVPASIGRFAPEPLFQEAVYVLGYQAPQLQQVGMSLKCSGEEEFGTFLVEEAEETAEERREFLFLLKNYDRSIRTGIRKISEPTEVHPLTGFARQPSFSGKSREGMFVVAGYARQMASEKRTLFGEILACEINAPLDPSPMRAFAERGIKRAEAKLQLFDKIKFGAY